ncbi:sigma-54-dependent transcriptional regulator [Pseudomarimonas arenosa]|uniref:Sigma-54-dependent Fis family transcriptional regulator n=1 Tax=Pseudomarimonas arenosa TaxID=2774145 RepID=A0AAW3ZLP0_9GAMM|nr:sigma-54 dependent transcriptional regulator [Pseudomarimonas arenosa]MBD8525835.1 sigma-54-dependent Fis family transcriptional regulator [Pseudomarimonas arenosa]
MRQSETRGRLLLVEDDPAQRELVGNILRGVGFALSQAESQSQALETLDQPDLVGVLSDYRLAEGDGLALLQEVRQRRPELSFILMTAYGSIQHAVQAVRAGADDYLTKPFERQALLLTLDKALRTRDLREENRRLNDALGERERLVDLIGRAPAMQRLYRQIERLAVTDATVLIGGESGTGKELVARALHKLSRRNERPFVAVNCAAIPEGLVEAEFFGAEKGAYTGAQAARRGHFENADGGTLFLDEIGELPLSLQPKLLRALQESRISRVGSSREVEVDVRVLAASNRDLAQEVREGRFREDLYWRLNVVSLQLPPLRERREDIPLLVEHLAARAARQHGLPPTLFPKHVLRALIDRPWSGNVRELANSVERLLLLAEDGEPRIEDLPDGPRRSASPEFLLPPEGLDWETLERSLLSQALQQAQGQKKRAAQLLGLPYKAFLYRVEKYGLDS